MQPHDQGPRKRNAHHAKHSEHDVRGDKAAIRRMQIDKLIEQIEYEHHFAARMLHEAGVALFPVSYCPVDGFIQSGFYNGCGNADHRTANLELDEDELDIKRSRWN